MGNLLLIVLVLMGAGLFWQQRKQSERALALVQQRCAQLQLQMLTVRRERYALQSPSGKRGLFCVYKFEFSADGEDAYEGTCWMQGLYLVRFDLPPHRIPGDGY